MIGAVIVSLLALAATAFYQANARLEKETEFRTHTGDRLDTIEKELIDLRALFISSQPTKARNQQAAKPSSCPCSTTYEVGDNDDGLRVTFVRCADRSAASAAPLKGQDFQLLISLERKSLWQDLRRKL